MSNYLDFSVQTIEEFKEWILVSLGHPLITVELHDLQLTQAINNALEIYTKYAPQDEEYVAVNLSGYVEDVGVTLPSNVVSVFSLDDVSTGLNGDVNRLFSVPNSMLNAGYIAIPFNTAGYGWVNWELWNQNLDMIKRMVGGGFQYEYRNRDKLLTLYPDPIKESVDGWIVLGVNVIRSDDMNYGEEWVKRYALAEAKIILGTIRGKYNGVQMLGGGNLDTSVKQEGISERDTLFDEIQRKQGPCKFWIG